MRACQVDPNCARKVMNVHCPKMQVREKDPAWCSFLMEHLPDTDDADDLTYLDNR